MSSRPVAAVVVVAAVLLASGCGGRSPETGAADPDAGHESGAADTSTCMADATPVSSMPEGYPTTFPLPAGTVVFHIEDRAGAGVIATGVTAAPFDRVLAAMNAIGSAGFKITTGETEDDDAEADWVGNGYAGRWAIKKSTACPGETVVQLLSKRS